MVILVIACWKHGEIEEHHNGCAMTGQLSRQLKNGSGIAKSVSALSVSSELC
jgi:hypothetical protein